MPSVRAMPRAAWSWSWSRSWSQSFNALGAGDAARGLRHFHRKMTEVYMFQCPRCGRCRARLGSSFRNDDGEWVSMPSVRAMPRAAWQ